MAATINFGSFSTIGGKTVAAGFASGLDTKTIIESSVTARQLPAKKLEEQISANASKVSALNEMKTSLNKLKDIANSLRNPPGIDQSANNIFASRKAFISSNTSVQGFNYVGVTANNGANVASQNITVLALATSKADRSMSFTSQTDSVTDAAGTNNAGKFSAGTFKINGKDVTLNQGDNLIEIASKINALKDQANVSAEIIKVADNDFRLVMQSTKTGVANAYTIDDTTSDVFSSTVSFNPVLTAGDATIMLNGVMVTRPSNTISDVIPNVTFNLYQITPPGTFLKVDVENNVEAAANKIEEFVNAYAEFKKFSAIQQEQDENGNFVATAILGRDLTLSNTISSLSNEISKIVPGIASGQKSRLSEIGVSFIDIPKDAVAKTPDIVNSLAIDKNALISALEQDFSGVSKIFEFNSVSSSNKLSVFSRSNNLSTTDIRVTVDTTKPVGQQVSILDNLSGLSYFADYKDGTITGKVGTSIEGAVMLYTGSGNDVIDMDMSIGIGDRMFNILEDLTKLDGGIDTAINTINEQNKSFTAEKDRINLQVEEFRSSLLAKYAALEEAVAKANSILQMLDAQTKAAQDA